MLLYFKTLIICSTVLISCKAEYHLVWEDNFDGSTLDENNWKYETGKEPNWGSNELQYYTDSNTNNLRVQNGYLVIEAHPEVMDGCNFTSARLNSKQSWIHGKFEVSAKLPKGKHLAPSIWLYPDEHYYGDWPSSGEIDIMESRGQKSDTIELTLHYGGAHPNNDMSASDEIKLTDLSEDFHVFSVEWDNKQMRWSVDGKEYYSADIDRDLWSHKGENPYTKNGQPFDKPFHWIFHLAVGGNWFPEDKYGPQVTPEEANLWSKPTFEVDYVRVYQQK